MAGKKFGEEDRGMREGTSDGASRNYTPDKMTSKRMMANKKLRRVVGALRALTLTEGTVYSTARTPRGRLNLADCEDGEATSANWKTGQKKSKLRVILG